MKTSIYIYFIFTLYSSLIFAQTKNPLIEIEGCPDNADCNKETGAYRQEFIDKLSLLNEKKISMDAISEWAMKKQGFPLSVWGHKNDFKINYSIWWNSPCKQHNQKDQSQYLIAEIFAKTTQLDESVSRKYFFPKAIISEANQLKTLSILRGDSPLKIIDNAFYYTREIEGKFYGLLVKFNGEVKLTNPRSVEQLPKESNCSKDLIAEFYRKAPHLNFYSGYYCKDIYNENLKQYQTIILGWSCN